MSYSLDALNRVINEALGAIAAEGDWPWLETSYSATTVAGQANYPLPADLYRARSLTVNGDEQALRSSRDLDADPTAEGYALNGANLTVSPTPGTAGRSILVRYFRQEPELFTDSDTPLVPAAYNGIIVAYAAAIILRRRSEWKRAESEERQYDEWLARMRKGVMRSTGPRRIRVRPGGAFGR